MQHRLQASLSSCNVVVHVFLQQCLGCLVCVHLLRHRMYALVPEAGGSRQGFITFHECTSRSLYRDLITIVIVCSVWCPGR